MKKLFFLLSIFLLSLTSCLFQSETEESSTNPIPVPTGVIASQGTSATQIDISWNAVSGASNYYVYRSTSSSGTYILIGSIDASYTSTYNSTTSPSSYPITAGTHYFYKVTAEDSSGNESSMSSAAEGWASSVLSAPTGVTASQGTSSTQIDISWNAVSGASYYYVYRATSSTGTYTLIGSISAAYTATYNSTTSPSSYPITVGTHYFYKVTAEDSAGNESDMSAAAEGWAYQSLSAPTGVTASQGTSATQIDISWNAVNGASYYYVYRATSSSGTYTLISSISATYTATNNSTTAPSSYPITAGTHYFYKVTAVDSSGNESDKSAAAEGWASSPAYLKIVNSSSYDVYFLYLKTTGSSSWGSDQLGANLIYTGYSYTLNVAAGTYDIKVQTSSYYNKCAYLSGVTLSSGLTFTATVTSWYTCSSKMIDNDLDGIKVNIIDSNENTFESCAKFNSFEVENEMR